MSNASVLNPLELCLREIEAHVATEGWDAPVRVFALARTAEALAADPELAGLIDTATKEAAEKDPEHLFAIEQEGLPQAQNIQELLGSIEFGSAPAGAAISLERVVISPEAERDLPADPDEALEALMNHPDRRDVRLVVGVLRDGTKRCAIRQRANDSADMVAFGEDLVPGLSQALLSTLS